MIPMPRFLFSGTIGNLLKRTDHPTAHDTVEAQRHGPKNQEKGSP